MADHLQAAPLTDLGYTPALRRVFSKCHAPNISAAPSLCLVFVSPPPEPRLLGERLQSVPKIVYTPRLATSPGPGHALNPVLPEPRLLGCPFPFRLAAALSSASWPRLRDSLAEPHLLGWLFASHPGPGRALGPLLTQATPSGLAYSVLPAGLVRQAGRPSGLQSRPPTGGEAEPPQPGKGEQRCQAGL